MKRVLMVSPHFPPDSSAATHRVRLLAPHLPEFGWTPTVLTVEPKYYEGRLDPDLLAMVPEDLEVVRARAWSPSWTRALRFGDLGLRSLLGLRRACRRLVRERQFHCLFITIYPSYTALLGPSVKRWASIPFVLDYQDPWVGAWGLTAGPGSNGRPDVRSRLSRTLAARLEPIAVEGADAITAVSAGTYEAVRERIETARNLPCMEIPIGGEPSDFDYLQSHPRSNRIFDATDGKLHLSYVGTLLPLGHDTLRGFLRALAMVKEKAPSLYAKLRVHFVGTSNQTAPSMPGRVAPEASSIGVADVVHEVPSRVDYVDSLNVLAQSRAVLLMGSSEKHYTASKLYPALMSKRPLVAIFHEASSVVSILRGAKEDMAARLVTYDDREGAETRVDAIYAAIRSACEDTSRPGAGAELDFARRFSARAMAERLAGFLTEVVHRKAV